MAKKRILIIDDEASITRTMKVNLERTGAYTVRTENQAGQALAAAREFEPDLILLDVIMPEKDGGEVAAEIKAEPALQHVPIVFLTAIVGTNETGGDYMDRGGQTFVAKPANLNSLIQCIDENIDGAERVDHQDED
jgi:CheY-like chemotaxis protein